MSNEAHAKKRDEEMVQNDQFFVEFIDETVATLKEIDATEGAEFERATRQSWDYDDKKRRDQFGGGYAEFRQHVRNALDAE